VTGWDPQHVPSQAGRTVVVTGGNAGIGYFTAEQLARAGAHVVLASRTEARARAAIASIEREVPGASAAFVQLDLTSLASVARAGAALRDLGPLHGFINNAGLVISPRTRRTTEDGLELITGGNFFGHYALTAQVFPALAPDARIVGLGSMSTRMVRLDPGDLLSERRYSPFRAYAFSKHLVHGFALELARRLHDSGSSRRSLLAHPGFAVTGLASTRAGITEQAAWRRHAERTLFWAVGQGKDAGAWPSVRAMTDPDAGNGAFLGPSRLLTGLPAQLAPVASSASPAFGAQLWALAERLTGVPFPVGGDQRAGL
jgi:NAD(P)-dependent dehydrogenase (short-subunit alcohol dehydrogenase family)